LRLRAGGSHIWFQVGSVDEAKAASRRGVQFSSQIDGEERDLEALACSGGSRRFALDHLRDLVLVSHPPQGGARWTMGQAVSAT
jgi:hypothetical protein